MPGIIDSTRKQLLENADEKKRDGGKRFFKEEVRLYGVKTAVVTKIGKQAFKSIEGLSKGEILDLCEELWKSGILEESFIACNWSYSIRDRFTADDFKTLEEWVDAYISNWASCDTLCNHTIGSFLERFPSYVQRLKKWGSSENRWVRRASAVSLVLPARKGLFRNDIFEIADILLMDSDDMVQKGYGWMLKSLADACEDDVYRYVISKKSVIPRTALRYAIEKMPDEKKREAMKRT